MTKVEPDFVRREPAYVRAAERAAAEFRAEEAFLSWHGEPEFVRARFHEGRIHGPLPFAGRFHFVDYRPWLGPDRPWIVPWGPIWHTRIGEWFERHREHLAAEYAAWSRLHPGMEYRHYAEAIFHEIAEARRALWGDGWRYLPLAPWDRGFLVFGPHKAAFVPFDGGRWRFAPPPHRHT